MIDPEFTRHMLVNQGKQYNRLFRAANELLAMHPVAAWERPLLRFVRWWYGRQLAEVLELLLPEQRKEVVGIEPES